MKIYFVLTLPAIVTPRKFGTKGKDTTYQIGGVLNAIENREVEFKSLTNTQTAPLPWKIMEKAKTFICACLNGDRIGTIYFGVKDSHKRGEIIGLDVEDAIDDIVKAFQFVLDDHIMSDVGPLQKGGEQNCVNLEFVPVVNEESRTGLYVIEIEVNRDWKFCEDHVYYCKSWDKKTEGCVNQDKDTPEKKRLTKFYKVRGNYDGVVIRTCGATKHVSEHMDYFHVRKPLMEKYAQWQREAKLG